MRRAVLSFVWCYIVIKEHGIFCFFLMSDVGCIAHFEQNTALFAKLIKLLLCGWMRWKCRKLEVDHRK